MNKYPAFACAFLFTLTIALVPAVRTESERSQPGRGERDMPRAAA